MSASNKVLLAAVACLVGTFQIVDYILTSQHSAQVDGWTISDPGPSVWDYLAYLLLLCSIGLIVAGIRLRR